MTYNPQLTELSRAPTKETVEALMLLQSKENAAIASLGDYYHQITRLGIIGSMTIDQLITNSFQLRKVHEYIHCSDHEMNVEQRMNFIRKMIVKKIRDYIDEQGEGK